MGKKYALYIGRWQNWHKGYEWLINQQLEKDKNIWIAIRNVPADESNKKSAQEVMMELAEVPFIRDNSHRIQLSIIPDIESINYGKKAGYDVIEHQPPAEFFDMDNTSHYMDSNGDVIFYQKD